IAAQPPIPRHISMHWRLASPSTSAQRLRMQVAVSALQGFSQRGAASAEDATATTADAARRTSRLLLVSSITMASVERALLPVARQPPGCLPEVDTASPIPCDASPGSFSSRPPPQIGEFLRYTLPHGVKALVTPLPRSESGALCSSARAGGIHMRTGRLVASSTLVVALATIARAATITVNSTADTLATDGNCTLREAILAANSDTAVDACAAGSGPDVVVVPAGTYSLAGNPGDAA